MKKLTLVAMAVAAAVVLSCGTASAFNKDVKVADIQFGKVVMGDTHSTDSLKGKVVLVEFWGVNCPPCRTSLPKLAKWQTKHEAEGLVIIGIHCQSATDEKVKSLCESSGVNFSIYASGRIKGGNDFNGIPHCFLFDHEGNCIYRGSPFTVETQMKEALAAAPAAILAGRKLTKLAAVGDMLKSGAAPATVMKQLASKTRSKDAVTADEAKWIIGRLEEHGKSEIERAKSLKVSDPWKCCQILTKVESGYRFTALGKEAKSLLGSYKKETAFRNELAAYQTLEIIKGLEKKLKPIRTMGGLDTKSARFKSANRATLQQIAQGVALMKARYAASKATGKAEAIARKYGLM